MRVPVVANSKLHDKLAAITSQLDALEHSLQLSAARVPERALAVLPSRDSQPTVRAARRLNRASGMLAFSVLADSAVEHYRGSFENKAMFTPLVISALGLAVSAHGTADNRPDAHRLRVYELADPVVGDGRNVATVVGVHPGLRRSGG